MKITSIHYPCQSQGFKRTEVPKFGGVLELSSSYGLHDVRLTVDEQDKQLLEFLDTMIYRSPAMVDTQNYCVKYTFPQQGVVLNIFLMDEGLRLDIAGNKIKAVLGVGPAIVPKWILTKETVAPGLRDSLASIRHMTQSYIKDKRQQFDYENLRGGIPSGDIFDAMHQQLLDLYG